MSNVPPRTDFARIVRVAVLTFCVLAAAFACSKKHDNNPIAPNPSPPPSPPPGATLSLSKVVDAGEIGFPVFVTAPVGDSRLFILEKHGVVRIRKAGNLLATPFLDISGIVTDDGLEQGLLGLAFDPGYATNRRFYVCYTNVDGDLVVSRYLVSSNPDLAAAGGQVLLTVDHPPDYDNHYGGTLAFGPDGKLYVAVGDGGGTGDPLETGQDRTDLHASLLRIDVSGSGGYGIPGDNPYVANQQFRREIWAYGLRNPWGFSFDRVTGDLYLSDVGQGEREEVNVATSVSGLGKGLNYGWSVLEGTRCLDSSPCDLTGKTPPTLEYDHGQGCSISGGAVYRGTAIPWLSGTYFYGDYCQGWVRSFRYQGGVATEQKEWSSLYTRDYVVSIGQDGLGEVYVLTQVGHIYKIVSP